MSKTNFADPNAEERCIDDAVSSPKSSTVIVPDTSYQSFLLLDKKYCSMYALLYHGNMTGSIPTSWLALVDDIERVITSDGQSCTNKILSPVGPHSPRVKMRLFLSLTHVLPASPLANLRYRKHASIF